MADNTLLNGVSVSGGNTIMTENISGVQIPVSKIRLGAQDVDGGDVTTSNPFPVAVQGTVPVSGSVTVSGTVTANAGTGTFNVDVTNTPTVTANAGTGTFTVSVSNTPTVTANAGTGTFTVSGNNTLAPGSGTGVKCEIVGAVYNSSPPSFTSGQVGALQVNSAGNLLVSQVGTATISGTVTANAGTGTFSISGTNTLAPASGSGVLCEIVGGVYNSSAPTFTAGEVGALQLDAAGNLKVNVEAGGGGGGGSAANLQAAPITLFDATTNQAGVSQLGQLFPHTVAITTGLPTIGSGNSTTLTDSSHTCGAVFSGTTSWASALMQFATVGGSAGSSQMTVEIGRVPAAGAMAEALASVTLTTSSLTIGPTTTNPFTGATGHSSVTWVLFDVTSITSYSQIGDVLQAVGGYSGVPSQLNINVSAESYYYVVITSLAGAYTEILCAITPTT